MKKIILIVFLAFALASCSKNDNSIKIGAILPLTGDAALYGLNAKAGIDLAVEEVNNSGGVLGKKIMVIYEDSRADPKSAVAAFSKLASVDKAQAVIGGVTSSATLAMAPLAEKNRIVLFSPAATSPALSNAGKYIFRDWPSDAYESSIILNYASRRLKVKKVALLLVNNDYGRGIENAVQKELKSDRMKITDMEYFDQQAVDFRTQLSKIKQSFPDAIYIVSYPEEMVGILQQIKELGIKATLLATSAFQDKVIIDNAGNASEGVIYPYPVPSDTSDPEVSSFLSNFQKRYGKKPGIVGDTGFDALKMIVAAIEATKGFTGPDIQKGLMTLKNYHGASGIMTFDSNGDVEKAMKIRTVRNGEFIDLN